jgi:hypothetical protein
LEKIVQISYAGDIRFSAGAENPRKVQNIVNYSLSELSAIYLPLLTRISQTSPIKLDRSNLISYQLTAPLLSILLQKLPTTLTNHLIKIYGGPNLMQNLLLAGVGDLSKDLIEVLVKINRWSSFKMASENLLTASPINNARYLLAKLSKRK